jgi:hypothetical protein
VINIKAIAYVGFWSTTPIEVEVTEQDTERGYAYVPCFECEGTGIWDYYPKDFFDYEKEIPVGKEFQCINCKCTGKVLINC